MTADPQPAAEASVAYCPVFHGAIELIGERWTGAIFKVLFDSSRSFGAMRDEVPGLSDRLLTERLNTLTSVGLVEKVPSNRAGSYHLTTMGQYLRPVFRELESFSDRWVDAIRQ